VRLRQHKPVSLSETPAKFGKECAWNCSYWFLIAAEIPNDEI